MSSVCLSACWQLYAKTTECISAKIFTTDVSVDKEEVIKLWKSHTSRNFLKGFLSTARQGIFPQFGSYLWINVTLNEEVAIKFQSHPDPESGSVYGFRIWTNLLQWRSVFSECSRCICIGVANTMLLQTSKFMLTSLILLCVIKLKQHTFSSQSITFSAVDKVGLKKWRSSVTCDGLQFLRLKFW